MSDLIERFFHSGIDFWTMYAPLRERSPALPGNPTAALGLVAIARAEPTLPPSGRHAGRVLSFLPEAIRNQVAKALLADGLVRSNIAGALDLTEQGNAAVAALRETAAATPPEDWSDPPPAIPAERAPLPWEPREEEQVIPLTAPEDYLDPPEEDDEELPERPISWSQAVQEYGLDTRRTVKAPPQPPAPAGQPTSAPAVEKPAEPPRRKSIVNRGPPGVPRY